MKTKYIRKFWRAGIYSLLGIFLGAVLCVFLLLNDYSGKDYIIFLFFPLAYILVSIPGEIMGISESSSVATMLFLIIIFIQWPSYGFIIGLKKSRKTQFYICWTIAGIHLIAAIIIIATVVYNLVRPLFFG